MKNLLLCFLLLLLFQSSVSAQLVGEVIFTTDFDKDAGWIDAGGSRSRYVNKDGESALMIKKGKLKLPILTKGIAGTKVAIKARIMSDGTADKPKPWNGIKLMMHVPVPWDDIYQQVDFPVTAFDWKEDGFTAYIPPEADTVWLYIGLEDVKGKIWLDKLTVTVTEPARNKVVAKKLSAPYTGHDEKALRGLMVSTELTEADLRDLASWGANHIRWQLTWGGFPFSKADTASIEAYMHWLHDCLQRVDGLLPVCKALGVKVVIDLHTLPGGRMPGVMTNRLFQEAAWQKVFIDVWKEIADKYKNETIIWGYDLANEPDEGLVPDGLHNWQQLATLTAQEIRKTDTTHAIIIEGAPRGGPEALARMEPIAVDKIVYSFHMYVPALFTHQGVYSTDSSRYPGIIQNREWNIATMRKTFEQVRRWQQDYNTHIYVGEFSAVRWATAQSAYYYMRDCIDLFEEYGWDWAYHAFREWDGWSVEYTETKSDDKPATMPTERQQLLIKSFARNKK